MSERKGTNGIGSKLPELRKFYITPFTDEDIKHFLRIRYRFKRKKQNQSWKIISQNKNLSVRPLLLRFMDELLADGKNFKYDFQLYECLFHKWIDREKKSLKDEKGEELCHYGKLSIMARCEFSCHGLKCYYDSCMKYQNLKVFLEKLDLICLERGTLSRDELSSFNEFIEENKSEMEIDFVRNLEIIYKRMKSFQ